MDRIMLCNKQLHLGITTVLMLMFTFLYSTVISSLHGVIRSSYTYLLLYNVFQIIEHAHTHDRVNMCMWLPFLYQLSNVTTYESSLLHSHSNVFFDIPLLLASNACAHART